jgi:hypothetical protein
MFERGRVAPGAQVEDRERIPRVVEVAATAALSRIPCPPLGGVARLLLVTPVRVEEQLAEARVADVAA